MCLDDVNRLGFFYSIEYMYHKVQIEEILHKGYEII